MHFSIELEVFNTSILPECYYKVVVVHIVTHGLRVDLSGTNLPNCVLQLIDVARELKFLVLNHLDQVEGLFVDFFKGLITFETEYFMIFIGQFYLTRILKIFKAFVGKLPLYVAIELLVD